MSTSKVTLGVLAGIATGAVLGILFAPQKGSTTRKQILSKKDDYMDKLKSNFSDLGNSLKDQFDNVKQDASDLAEKGKAKYDNLKKEIENSN